MELESLYKAGSVVGMRGAEKRWKRRELVGCLQVNLRGFRVGGGLAKSQEPSPVAPISSHQHLAGVSYLRPLPLSFLLIPPGAVFIPGATISSPYILFPRVAGRIFSKVIGLYLRQEDSLTLN